MNNDGEIRASDSDRERIVEILRSAYTDGRLTLDEFDDRTTTAYAARTWADLRDLTRDLPVDVDLRRPAAARPFVRAGEEQTFHAGGLPAPIGRPRFFPLLPLIILLFVLAGSAHAAVLALPAIMILFVCLRVAGRHTRGHGPGRSLPPGQGSGSA